ncbi:phage tail spike protein [Bacillus sp. JJ1562]|uniref:phage tail spike protein n=1 Tax=Bacillus sp. JJ1562 TaxID=3122960 RepID=UPI0030027D2F
MALIHILDKQTDKIIGTLDKGEYIHSRRFTTTDNKNKIEFTALTKLDKLNGRNRLVLQDRDGFFEEYIILFSDQPTRSQKIVIGTASFVDLNKADAIPPASWDGQTAQTATETTLNGTEWRPGNIEFAGIRKITISERMNPYELLKYIASTFGLVLRFRIEVKGNRIVGRYVDMFVDREVFEGKEIEFGKDLIGLRRVENSTGVVTALRGFGPEREDGTRIEVLIEDEEARQRWGRNGKHLIEDYYPESDDQNMTLERLTTLTENELKKRIDSNVSYECKVATIEHIAGHYHEIIRIGQITRTIDDGYSPPLYLEASFQEIVDDPSTGKVLECKIGNFVEYKKEDLEKQVALLKQVMSDRLVKLVQSTVVSSSGDIFKNGLGQTTLTAKTFLGGFEVDSDGDKYSYQWVKRDKDGNVDTTFNQTGKSINVSSSDVEEKSTFVAEIAISDKTSTVSQITISKVFDGADGQQGPQGPKGEQGSKGADGYTPIKGTDYFDGKDGQNGKDGSSSYLWVKYSQNSNGNPMSDNPAGALYIGVATTTTPSAPSSYTSYKWGLFKGSDGVPGEPGADGSTSYLHVKYSNDGGKNFTANNGETVGEWIGTYVDFNSADSNNVSSYTWNKVKGDKGDKGDTGPRGPQGPNIVDSTTEIEANVIKANHVDIANLFAYTAFIENLGAFDFSAANITGGKIAGAVFTSSRGDLGAGNFQHGTFKEGIVELLKFNNLTEVVKGLTMSPGLIKSWGSSFDPTVIEGSFKFDQPIVQNPFISPSFQNFWVNYDRGFEPIGYRKNSNNTIEFKGRISSGSIGQTRPMFRLANGHIPSNARTFPVLTDTGIGNLTIFNNGDVCLLSGGNGWVSLDGVSFPLT